MTPCCRAQGPGGVQKGRALGLPPRGMDGGSEAEHTAGGGGSGGNHHRGSSPRRTSTVTGKKDWGLADGAAVHGEWDGSGGSGMT